MMEGNLVTAFSRTIRSLARQARIQGLVVLRAMISRDGAIENLQVLSGHPMLVRAASTPCGSGATGPTCSTASRWKWKPR